MDMICKKCGKIVSASGGEYVYYRSTMFFACKECANNLNYEIKCAMKVCAAIDGKKNQAEVTINNRDAFDTFLKNINAVQKKIPKVGTILSDVSLLVSLVKSYVANDYTEVPYTTVIAVMAALLYVISPIDMLPDVLPGIGYEDDAMVVAFCIKFFHDDLAGFINWNNK